MIFHKNMLSDSLFWTNFLQIVLSVCLLPFHIYKPIFITLTLHQPDLLHYLGPDDCSCHPLNICIEVTTFHLRAIFSWCRPRHLFPFLCRWRTSCSFSLLWEARLTLWCTSCWTEPSAVKHLDFWDATRESLKEKQRFGQQQEVAIRSLNIWGRKL